MSNTVRRIAKSGFEVDAFESREYLKCFSRPGVARAAKRAANRRERQLAVREMLLDLAELTA